MNREQAINYLKSSGMNDEQIKAVIDAFTCDDCISKEETLKLMCEKCPVYDCITGCQSYRSIEKMPSVTPSYNTIRTELKPSEDCISRDAVIRFVEQYPSIFGNRCSELIADIIKHLPSVTPTISDDENNYNIGYNCGYADAMIDIAEGE